MIIRAAFALIACKQTANDTFEHAHAIPLALPVTPSTSRRMILSGGALSLSQCWIPKEATADSNLDANSPDGSSWAPPSLMTNLGKSRISASELSPLGGSFSPLADPDLYYAPFLFGTWNVTATLKRKIFPFGKDYVPSRSLIEGSPRNRQELVGATTSYELHFFSTLANTVANQLTVNLGLGVPQSKIIADREFNAISISQAYRQLTPVQEVDWDPRKDPTRLTLSYGAGPLADDMRPLGQRRTEIYITARQSEEAGPNIFCAAERSRSVTLGPGFVLADDTESITEFRMVDPNRVEAVSRIAVYLTPNPNSREGVLWQQVGGKAVAFFDYEIQFTRVNQAFVTSDGTEISRACVKTPKDVIQCS